MTGSLEERFPLLRSWINCENEDLHRILRDRQETLLKSKTDILPRAGAYLNSRLHDSELLGIERNEQDLCIVVNEFSTRCFCQALRTAARLPCPDKEAVFPLTLKFKSVKTWSLNTLDYVRDEYPADIRISHGLTEHYSSECYEWLYDETAGIEPTSVSLGIILWAKTRTAKNRKVLFHVESDAMTFCEAQESAFLESFEGKYADLFEAFWKERQAGRVFDYSSALDFINRTRMQI